jgi:MFS family permease
MTDLDLIAQAPARPPTRARRRSPLPVLMCGVSMIVLDFFIVNVALPSIQAELHAGSSAVEWVVAGYGLTCAVLLIGAGRLGDLYGRRRMFCAGMALFVVASAACGLAPTAGVLVAARLIQGIGAALISPNVLSIIGVSYPGAARVRALTIYGLVMGLAAAGGQLIGGVLIQADVLHLGWRTVFLINVPVGVAALAFARRQVTESTGDAAQPGARRIGQLDLGGLLLAGAGMGLTITPLTTTVLAYARPERAGAVSGVLSTMQQVGGSLGVAVTGVIFFGALHGASGYARGLELSLAQLAILLVVVAGLTRLLPRPKG